MNVSTCTRRPPLYPINMWNQYNATLEGMPRTNNSVEGWHRGFDALTTRYHHSLYDIIENFRREQGLNELMVEQDYAGGPLYRNKDVLLLPRTTSHL